MFKLMRVGGTVLATSTIMGVLNGKFNKPKKPVPKFEPKEFEEKVETFKKAQETTPKLSIPKSTRADNLKSLQTIEFDVLVIGGGATGTGVLFNLYNKGLKCGLIEANDFASGTSSRSTKLAHGGIRYLQEVFEFKSDAYEKYKLVIEALIERDFFVNSAPHMNRIIEIKIPLSGVALYHTLYVFKSLPNVFYSFPGPKIYFGENDQPNSPVGKKFNYFVSLHEGQMFDSRQDLLSLLSTTIDDYKEGSKGAAIANYTELVDFIYDNNNKLAGVKALDKIANKQLDIKAKLIINCAGIRADNLFKKDDPQFNKLITASKGTHVVMRNNIFGIEGGLMIPKTSDGRIIFILPYQEHLLIGTTDQLSEKNFTPSAEENEVDYIVNELKNYFKMDETLIRNNISAKWAGNRPLFEDSSMDHHDSKSISRGHVIKRKENGLVSVLGGKWTTYRKIGQDVVEYLEKENLIEKNLTSSTLNTKLYGSYHIDNLEKNYSYQEEIQILENLKNHIKLKYLIDQQTADKLVFYYGFSALKVLELGAQTKTNNKLLDELPVLESQILYSIKHEMAQKPNDIICRRIGLAFLDEKLAESLIEKISEIMSKELKWSSSRTKKEIKEAKENLKYML